MRKILLLLPFLLMSCGHGSEISFSGGKMILRGTPTVIVTPVRKPAETRSFLALIHRMMLVWKNFSDFPTNAIILADLSNRTMFYPSYLKVADQCFENAGNKSLAFGAIQYLWLSRWSVRDKIFGQSAEKQSLDGYYIVGIREFQKVFKKYGISESRFFGVYKMMNRYLLDHILFVSVQELMARPYRYFNEKARVSGFAQLVSFPEMALFYSFIRSRFSANVVRNLIDSDYSVANWKKYTGEAVHETEGAFRDMIKKNGSGDLNKEKRFREAFFKLLKLYHTGTKSTLFHQ